MEGPVVCSTCGAKNDAAARFCSTCGSRLAPAAEVPAARPPAPAKPTRELERKVITALFCDVVGSSSHSPGKIVLGVVAH